MRKDPDLVLPNLFIPGAGKSGTSSLHAYLAQSEHVYMSDPKEIHFFSDPAVFQRGLDYYARLFDPGRDRMIRGESSTTYLFMPGVIERLQELVPNAKFIFILRNPVDRILSHYRWLGGLGLEFRPLRAAVEADRFDVPDFSRRIHGNKFCFYFAESCYGRYVGSYIQTFGTDRVLLVTTEQLRTDPAGVLSKCLSFLDVPLSEDLHPVWTNQTAGTFDASSYAEDRAWLADQLVGDVALLRSQTGLPFSEWLEDFPIQATGPTLSGTASSSAGIG